MNRVFVVTPTHRAALAVALSLAGLAGCSSVEGLLSGDKVDYRSQATKTSALEVPPDLTQLARDTRYQPQSSVVSAKAMQSPGGPVAVATAPAATADPVAPAAIGDLHIERQGNVRWLVSAMPPEQLWPQLRAFWQERGFTLAQDHPELGVMETDWAENRAKLPQDIIRSTLGKVLDSLYSTSERDRFRTRVERVGSGSEVYISHRGMIEVYTSERKDSTVWQPRPADPQLEAEFLSRLMVRLGVKEEVARSVVATAPDQPTRARALTNAGGAALEVDEAFDRAWRRVGLALDRGGFTVEDRDRGAGIYFVRYVDPKRAGEEEPGFFSKLFSFSKSAPNALQRYRVAVKAAGDKTQVSVQNNQGAADNGEAARAITARLIDELK